MNYPESIDEFFADTNPRAAECKLLRQILTSFPELNEQLKWGIPVYALDDKKHVVGIGSFKNWSSLWFTQGALLKDKAKKLVNAQPGTTKAQRQWRFSDIEEIKENEKLIKQYVKETIENHQEGREIQFPSKPKIQHNIPSLLSQALSHNKNLNDCFQALSLACQNEYIDYVADAKKEETQLRRIEKIKPMILDRVGLNDKYK